MDKRIYTIWWRRLATSIILKVLISSSSKAGPLGWNYVQYGKQKQIQNVDSLQDSHASEDTSDKWSAKKGWPNDPNLHALLQPPPNLDHPGYIYRSILEKSQDARWKKKRRETTWWYNGLLLVVYLERNELKNFLTYLFATITAGVLNQERNPAL